MSKSRTDVERHTQWFENKEEYCITQPVKEFLESIGKLEEFMRGETFEIEGGTYYHKVECDEHGEDCRGYDVYFSYAILYTRIQEEKDYNSFQSIRHIDKTKGRPILCFEFSQGDCDGNWECLFECAWKEIHTKKDLDYALKIIDDNAKDADDMW